MRYILKQITQLSSVTLVSSFLSSITLRTTCLKKHIVSEGKNVIPKNLRIGRKTGKNTTKKMVYLNIYIKKNSIIFF